MEQKFGMVMAAFMSVFLSSYAVVIFPENHSGAIVFWILALICIAIIAFGAYDIGLRTKRFPGMIEPPEPWPKPPHVL